MDRGSKNYQSDQQKSFNVVVEQVIRKSYQVRATDAIEAEKKVKEMVIRGVVEPIEYHLFPFLTSSTKGPWEINVFKTEEKL
jgi:Neuraminidase (sialidase)